MKEWKLFVRTMKIMGKRCALYMAAIIFMSAGMAMFSVMTSMLIKNVVDSAQTGNSNRMLRIIIEDVIGGFVSLLVFRASSVAYNVEAKRAYGNLCKMLFHHEVRLPYSYYEKHHSGELLSKLSYDMEKMGSIYGSRFRRMLAPFIYVIVFLVPMLLLSRQITLCLVGVNLLMFLINGLFIKPIKNITGVLSRTNSKMTEKLSDLLQGMEQVRMYSAGSNTVGEFTAENETYAKQSKRRNFYTACLDSCNNGFDLLCALAFLLLGIYFVQNNYTTLGSLTAIYSLYGKFSYQFLQMGRYIPELISCLTNAQNIFDFMEEAEEPDCWYKGIPAADFKNAEADGGKILDIDRISFRYCEEKPLLQNYSLSVRKGECVAVTGPSGCGKTTLSKLLLGLYPAVSGDIRIKDASYHKLTNAEIRRRIAYVPQEPYLFNESVRDNIRIGRLNASDEEVVWAAKTAHAHTFIEKLENGYDTFVGERGNLLSGGQRQRIAIARAILKDAPVILLDEATSALDNESERLLNDALKSMKNQKTIIMIAHRPSTIALADQVYSVTP